MTAYPFTRKLLFFVIILGWTGAIVGLILGVNGLHLGWSAFALIVSSLLGGAFNHAVMLVGLAVIDLVDAQVNSTHQSEMVRHLGKIAAHVGFQQKSQTAAKDSQQQ